MRAGSGGAPLRCRLHCQLIQLLACTAQVRISPGKYGPWLQTQPLPPACSFSWTRNGKFFNVAKDPKVSMRWRSGTLVIDFHSGGRPEDYEGEYQCFARNDFGTALSSKIHLQVSSE